MGSALTSAKACRGTGRGGFVTADHPRGIHAYRDEDPAFDRPAWNQPRADVGILGFSSNTGAALLGM